MAGSLDPLANFSQANLTENTGEQVSFRCKFRGAEV
jgi:hypothetical protein